MDDRKEIRVGVCKLRGNLTRYLSEASRGTSVLVTSRATAIATIGPPSPKVRAPRVPGALKGQIWMADDFNTLPDDILDASES